ncbi:MAG: hypothetical protein ACK5O7_05065 [Holosporales bacterium]
MTTIKIQFSLALIAQILAFEASHATEEIFDFESDSSSGLTSASNTVPLGRSFSPMKNSGLNLSSFRPSETAGLGFAKGSMTKPIQCKSAKASPHPWRSSSEGGAWSRSSLSQSLLPHSLRIQESSDFDDEKVKEPFADAPLEVDTFEENFWAGSLKNDKANMTPISSSGEWEKHDSRLCQGGLADRMTRSVPDYQAPQDIFFGDEDAEGPADALFHKVRHDVESLIERLETCTSDQFTLVKLNANHLAEESPLRTNPQVAHLLERLHLPYESGEHEILIFKKTGAAGPVEEVRVCHRRYAPGLGMVEKELDSSLHLSANNVLTALGENQLCVTHLPVVVEYAPKVIKRFLQHTLFEFNDLFDNLEKFADNHKAGKVMLEAFQSVGCLEDMADQLPQYGLTLGKEGRLKILKLPLLGRSADGHTVGSRRSLADVLQECPEKLVGWLIGNEDGIAPTSFAGRLSHLLKHVLHTLVSSSQH